MYHYDYNSRLTTVRVFINKFIHTFKFCLNKLIKDIKDECILIANPSANIKSFLFFLKVI